MPESLIQYCGQSAKVCCDGNCRKAWGQNNRPKAWLSDHEDDYEYLADSELGEAPADPGTYEGGIGKPGSVIEFPTKWCVRECERCNMSDPGRYGEPLPVLSFDDRRKNLIVVENMKLSKRVPARTVTFEASHCEINWMKMSQRFREIRKGSRNPMDKCHWCEHPFADGEMMALAFARKGNRTLCQACAKELLSSRSEGC